MNATQHLMAACLAMVMLVFLVGVRLLLARVAEMRASRLRMQDVATSVQTAQLKNVQASDNFKNLFEVPVLFYVLCAIAIAGPKIPEFLPITAWAYVGLRYLHSLIQCTYNRVAHRFAVFFVSFGLIVAMWIGFFWSMQGMALAP
jgi:hypothetical protein